MAPTIEELDLMVQSFYDGRGEQVSFVPSSWSVFPAREGLGLGRARAIY